MKNPPFDRDKEKRVIAGLIKYGEEVWPDVSPFLTDSDFYQASSLPYSHRPIFQAIRHFLEEKKSFDYMSVVDRLKLMGVSFGSLNITMYLEELSGTLMKKNVFIEEVQDLVKVRVRRDLFMSFANAARYLVSNESMVDNLDEILAKCDTEYSKAVGNSTHVNKDAESLTENLFEFVEGLGEEESGKILLTPFPKFNDAFGGLRLKDSYCIAGRPGHGKSAILQYLAYSTANLVKENQIDGKNIPVLCIDTEMESDEQRIRLAACIAGVDPYLIETGKWRKNSLLVEKVRSTLPYVKEHSYDHIYAPRFTVEELASYVRRWVYKNVGRNDPGIIVFDYLKLSGDDLKNVSDSRLSVAYKLDRIKDLVKEETNCVLLFGAQRNRYQEKEDDSSIAESDHIQRLSNWVGLFKEKNAEELAQQPQASFGTHALIPVKSRKLGMKGVEFKRMLKIDGKYCNNWFNFKFDNFKYIELNTGKDVENYLSV